MRLEARKYLVDTQLAADRIESHERMVTAYEHVGRMSQACSHRIALAAIQPKVVLALGSVATQALLRGADVDESVLVRAGVTAADEVTVVADVRGSAAYKKQLVRVYTTRAIRAALAASAVSGPAS